MCCCFWEYSIEHTLHTVLSGSTCRLAQCLLAIWPRMKTLACALEDVSADPWRTLLPLFSPPSSPPLALWILIIIVSISIHLLVYTKPISTRNLYLSVYIYVHIFFFYIDLSLYEPIQLLTVLAPKFCQWRATWEAIIPKQFRHHAKWKVLGPLVFSSFSCIFLIFLFSFICFDFPTIVHFPAGALIFLHFFIFIFFSSMCFFFGFLLAFSFNIAVPGFVFYSYLLFWSFDFVLWSLCFFGSFSPTLVYLGILAREQGT